MNISAEWLTLDRICGAWGVEKQTARRRLKDAGILGQQFQIEGTRQKVTLYHVPAAYISADAIATYRIQDAVYSGENRKKPIQTMPDGGGIYAIRHKATGRSYVGQTVTFAIRLDAHLISLKRGRHSNTQLQAAFDHEQGNLDAFEFVVLQEMWEGYGPEHDRAERAWIRRLAGAGVYNGERDLQRAFAPSPAPIKLTSEELAILQHCAAPEGLKARGTRYDYTSADAVYTRHGVDRLRRAGYIAPIDRECCTYIFRITPTGQTQLFRLQEAA